jgi:hypothetical protein
MLSIMPPMWSQIVKNECLSNIKILCKVPCQTYKKIYMKIFRKVVINVFCEIYKWICLIWDHIGGIIDSMLTSGAVYRGFEPRSVKPKIINLIFAATPLSMQHWGIRGNTSWLGINIMCQRGASNVPLDCCFKIGQ